MHLNRAIIALCLLFLFSCKNDSTEPNTKVVVPPSAGHDQVNIDKFEVKLDADSLKKNDAGEWSIESGLIDNKVFFDNKNNPKATFHGLPGETYQLIWKVKTNGTELVSKVKVSFAPLEVKIENESPGNKTKFFLSGTNYDKGQWTVEGKYARIVSLQGGGIHVPTMEYPGIMFQGYANTNYKITWTTYYGSKSASVTYEFKTGDYLESEALLDLQLQENSYRLTYENGHVVRLNLAASGIAWILGDTVTHPALQSLVHLKRLDLNGSATFKFPEVIGVKYKELEYLNLDGTTIPYVPEVIGNLTKLKVLIFSHPQGSRLYSFPDSFGKLVSLEYLDVAALGLRSLPESFSNLRNLKYFNFEQNNVQKLPDNIGNLTKLRHISGTTTENFPTSISKLTALKFASLTTESTNASLPSDFGNLKSLDSLRLTGPFRELPKSLFNLNLKVLELNTPNLITVPDNVGNMQELEYLTIAGQFKLLPSSFSDLTNLKAISIAGELEHLPNDIGKLKNLSHLYYTSGKLKDLPVSIGQLENLTELTLFFNLIEEIPTSLFDLPKISRLNFAYNKIKTLSSDFSKLSDTLYELNLNGNDYPIEEGLMVKGLLPNTRVYVKN